MTTTVNPDDADLVSAVTAMTGELAGLRADAEALRGYGRRNRHLIKIVGVSVALDILLSVGLAYAVHRADDASSKAGRSASSQVVSCRAGNATRQVQTDLWNYILTLPPPAGETPARAVEREAGVAKFKTYVANAFAPRDCEALLKEKP